MKLDLQTRDGRYGGKVLYFPFMTFSDPHLGSGRPRAEGISRMLKNTSCDRLFLVGDIVDGWALSQKARADFPAAHRNVLAHILRKAAGDTEVTYIPGNHDGVLRGCHIHAPDGRRHAYRKLTGRTLQGIRVEDEAAYTDPQGRRFLIMHGDKYDGDMSRMVYLYGEWRRSVTSKISDVVFGRRTHHPSPPSSRLLSESFSMAAWGRRCTKTVLDWYTDIRRDIALSLDRSPYDGIIYGHSHRAGFRRAFSGKMLVNDGACEEYPQTLVGDRFGNLGIITWRADRLEVEMEDGCRYAIEGAEFESIFGGTFGESAEIPEDEASLKADHLVRLICKLFPSREQMRMREARIQKHPEPQVS